MVNKGPYTAFLLLMFSFRPLMSAVSLATKTGSEEHSWKRGIYSGLVNLSRKELQIEPYDRRHYVTPMCLSK